MRLVSWINCYLKIASSCSRNPGVLLVKQRNLFYNLNVSFQCVEMDKMPEQEEEELRSVLKEKTGQTTVPYVFVDGKLLGGCSCLIASIQNGTFLEMIGGQDQ